MKLSQLHEDGHFAVWKNHPGGLGGTNDDDGEDNSHPGVPKQWVKEYEDKSKEMKNVDSSGKIKEN